MHQPAVNSPQFSAPPLSSHPNPSKLRSQPEVVKETEGDREDWAASWGDEDDWAGKVGDDEWTGKRLDKRTKEAEVVLREGWDTPAIVGS